jgi:NADH pyrophosphatase NudC (nudix superfamily)
MTLVTNDEFGKYATTFYREELRTTAKRLTVTEFRTGFLQECQPLHSNFVSIMKLTHVRRRDVKYCGNKGTRNKQKKAKSKRRVAHAERC